MRSARAYHDNKAGYHRCGRRITLLTLFTLCRA